jgi:archaellum component FlaF (FlaF/FlaG flagellin family)
MFVVGVAASAAAQFEARGSFPSSYNPYSIAVGDFNHDGKPDLAVADAANNIAVLLGNGDGTFKPAVYYTAGVGPVSVVAADFNHDGDLDLASVSTLDSYVSILLGNGDGTFQPATQTPPLRTGASFVSVGDFNNDKKLDLVVIDGICLSVLLGNGDGTFQPPMEDCSVTIGAIGVGDFNHDGNLDLATGGASGDFYVNILLGNGDGTFRQGERYSGNSPGSIVVADFNRDGNPDFVAGNVELNALSVWLGNGDGTFQPAVDYTTLFPTSVVVADFNGDGKLDLAASNLGAPGGTASVFLGNGDGTFQSGVSYPAGSELDSIAAGDFNGDHRTDLVVADSRNSRVNVLLNTGVVSFSPTTPLNFPGQLVSATSPPQTVTLTNTGATALVISSMKLSSAEFHMTSTCGSSVAAGAECAITVTFQPQSKNSHSGLITIRDSASTKPQVIELTGVGTVVSVSPSTLNFGSQKVGTKSAPLPVTVINHGSTVLNISSIKINLNASGNYSQTNDCGSQLAAGASCTVNVIFGPFYTGKINSQLAITDDGGASPQIVPLTGTGT